MNDKGRLNANMEYLKNLHDELSKLNKEYITIDKKESDYISKYSFKEILENKEIDNNVKDFDAMLKENIKKREILDYEKNIIYNNLDLILMDIINKELLPILKKYEGKKVGEKTKEKMRNDIKAYILDYYNVTCYFNIYKTYDFNPIMLSFEFYNTNNNYIRINNRNIELETDAKEYDVITYDVDKLFSYYVNYDYEYIELKNVSKYASNLYDMKVSTDSNINKLNNEINGLKQEFNKYCINNLNDYRISG